MRMRRILNQRSAMLSTDVPNLFDIRRNDPTHVDKQDGLGIRSDLAAQILGTHLKRLPLTIDKNHFCSSVYGSGGTSNESVAWNDNRRPFDTDSPKDELNGTGAVARTQSIFHSAIRRPLALEFLNIPPILMKPLRRIFSKPAMIDWTSSSE